MVPKEMLDVLDLYNQGLALYKERKWDAALQLFEKVLEIKSDDGPSKLYIERCRLYKDSPPPSDWDGVFTMTTK